MSITIYKEAHSEPDYRAFLDRPLATGCELAPIYTSYLDPVDGNDAWDGAQPAFVSGTIGPKKTLDTTLWAGSPKTSWFTGEIFLVRAGTTYTHTAATPIVMVTNKHLGAYWLTTDMNAEKPIIKATFSGGAGSGRSIIRGNGTITNVSLSDLTIDCSGVADRNGISFYQDADGQSITNITLNNISVIGGSSTASGPGATWYAGILFQYLNNYTRTTPYVSSGNILISHCTVDGFPYHGLQVNGVFGTPYVGFKDASAVTAVAVGATTNITLSATIPDLVVGGLLYLSGLTGANAAALNGFSHTVTAIAGNVYTISTNTTALTITAAGYGQNGDTLRYSGVDYLNCTAANCGSGYDSHGFTSFSHGVLADKTSLTFTQVAASTVYYTTVSAAAMYNLSVPNIELVLLQATSGAELFQLIQVPYASVSSSPQTLLLRGQYAFDSATQRLYVNINLALGTSSVLTTCARPARGIRYINCTAYNTRLPGLSGTVEGIGFAFDDSTSNSEMINCNSVGNAGTGISLNRGNYNRIVRCKSVNNGLLPIGANFGWGHVVSENTFIGGGRRQPSPTRPYAAMFMAHASISGFTSYANAGKFMSVFSSNTLEYTGTDTSVYLFWAADSGNAPQILFRNNVVNGSESRFTGRALWQGRVGNSSLPINVIGT